MHEYIFVPARTLLRFADETHSGSFQTLNYRVQVGTRRATWCNPGRASR